jgi:hypothetical protein
VGGMGLYGLTGWTYSVHARVQARLLADRVSIFNPTVLLLDKDEICHLTQLYRMDVTISSYASRSGNHIAFCEIQHISSC